MAIDWGESLGSTRLSRPGTALLAIEDLSRTVGAVLAIALLATVAWLVWRPWRQRTLARELDRACREFHQQRERLEARFFQLASTSGKPRGLAWTNCDFDDDVVYARELDSGQLAALVSVSISFAAIEGGGMEEVEAVGNRRAATAVFRQQNRQWTTQGRTIFNLNPAEAVAHFQGRLERVLVESTRGRDR